MSRPTGKSLKQARIERNQPVERVPLVTFLIRKILGLPRLLRIVIISIFALALTAVVFPAVDFAYMEHFFSESTKILPSFVSTGVGIIMYGVGWWLLVGMRGERRPERIGVFFYVLAGILIIAFVVYLIINGYSTANLPNI